ncbi:hypothetical protein Kpol_460p15 [Vanderwaltozyma polyspora DSM 70294]|uniref:Mitochondrial carrier protein n=1 Tax=Vanderwaltozyma polyspora (strain ATCC 22028 / DSM 70294 / BCRC 21397 / CBS 2163 / NBRC 10782 / NRRL Y-8283 / UCD 57-17) TaxID=436907 RepID=A7TQT1_VANPO|nr:uncharacterized protein Kpol_460p15 [Vanderwaltozyma polyspora DSM 70294]EDO15380.1 hypothetical protein Kpol_460p15 [Vanderwaltozyma polyspora DSM 70294]
MMHNLTTYFAGCSAVNIGVLLKTATRFTTFEYACNVLRDPNAPESSPISGTRLLLAGAITGFTESLLIIPFENIKTTMIENALLISEREQNKQQQQQQQQKPNEIKKRATFHNVETVKMHPREKAFYAYEKNPSTTLITTIREIYTTRGFRGYLKGTVPTIFRQVGNSVVRFTTYTALKQLISPSGKLDQYTAFGLGFVSSCAVVLVTQPIDVIKTRMQSKYAWKYYKNSLNCAYRIFVEEGFPKFWKGWAPRMFKVGLSGGISFGVYQYVETLMNTIQSEGFN